MTELAWIVAERLWSQVLCLSSGTNSSWPGQHPKDLCPAVTVARSHIPMVAREGLIQGAIDQSSSKVGKAFA